MNRGALPGPQTITVRRHPVVLTRPLVVVLAGLIVAASLGTSLHGASTFMDIVWIAWGVLLLRLVWKIIDWIVSYIVVTPQQLVQRSGVIAHAQKMMPLARVTDLSLRSSFLGRTLGYGNLIIEVAGQTQARQEFDCIPHVNELYLELSSWILKVLSGR